MIFKDLSIQTETEIDYVLFETTIKDLTVLFHNKADNVLKLSYKEKMVDFILSVFAIATNKGLLIEILPLKIYAINYNVSLNQESTQKIIIGKLN